MTQPRDVDDFKSSIDQEMDAEEPTLTSVDYSDAQKEVAEENLMAQTVSLQDAILNSANFASVATDAKGIVRIINVGAQRMLGYAPEDVVNKVVPGDMHDPNEIIARAAQLSAEFGTTIRPGFEALVYKASRGIEDVYELTSIRQDGSRFPTTVSVTALRNGDAQIIGYLLISTDNTARDQAAMAQSLLDQRLRDQQFYTRSLIESNIDALMMTDTRGVISDVNQQMIELTGRTRDELIGAPCRTFFTDPARADTAIRRVLTERRVNDYELTVRSLDGKETDVSYNAATFYDRDRVIQGVFASARDVTERKRFERALQQTNIDLEHASRMKTEFLTTMSHELRTPLNAIIGFSEALKDGLMGDMSESQREYIGDIYTSGHHLLDLINDILDLSKVEAGMMDIELEPVDVDALLNQCLLIVRDSAAAHSVELTFNGADDIGMPMLDIRKTKQILYNLLSNAVKFTPEHGEVTLCARRVKRDAVGKIAGTWPVHDFPLPKSDIQHFLEIRVVDTGMGVSAVNMSKLFLAFSQIDGTLARRYEGTGLGLATVKQMVELQGGTVAVASQEDEGACFAVWLPLGVDDETVPAWSDAAKRRQGLAIEKVTKTAPVTPAEPTGSAESADPADAADAVDPTDLIALDAQVYGRPVPGADPQEPGLESEPVPAAAKEKPNAKSDDSGARSDELRAGSEDRRAVLPEVGAPDDTEALRPESGKDTTSWSPVALVIEDDAMGAEVLRVLLEAEGFRVLVASSAEEGLELAPQQPVSLITLDIRLPGMDGWGFLMKLHELADLAQVPIVIIAGDTDVSLALCHGAAAVLEKPISRAALQSSLEVLGIHPDDLRTCRVLVADDDPETVDVVARILTRPEYAVERAFTKDKAIDMAKRLHPDLVLLNLMMENFSGYQVVLALQNDESTEHIPILVVTGKRLTRQEVAAVDGDPIQPVRVIRTENFDRTAFLAEVKRALYSGHGRKGA